ncbi:MAG: hypothetical protein LQ350_008096 [Teloschistes chrysophthalmus]|nr:MAG: hypothetical protein LQ350_008096 [Niorma chrysophthalma]
MQDPLLIEREYKEETLAQKSDVANMAGNNARPSAFGALLTHCNDNLWWCPQSSNNKNAPCEGNGTFTLATPVTLVTQLPLATPAAAQTSLQTTAIASNTTAGSTSKALSNNPANQTSASSGSGVPSPQQSHKTSRNLAIGLGAPVGVLGLSLILLLVYKLRQRTAARDHQIHSTDDGVIERHAPGVGSRGRLVEVAGGANSEMPLSTDSLEKQGTNLVEAL